MPEHRRPAAASFSCARVFEGWVSACFLAATLCAATATPAWAQQAALLAPITKLLRKRASRRRCMQLVRP